MISLKECVNKYSMFGLSDFEIIKQYFIENHCENQAVVMLTQLSTEQIKNLHHRLGYLQEIIAYTNVIFANQIPEKIKIKLHNLCIRFIYKDLDEKELQEAKEIFDNYGKDIKCCWNVFYNYLVEKGCIKDADKLSEYQSSEMHRLIKLLRENDS